MYPDGDDDQPDNSGQREMPDGPEIESIQDRLDRQFDRARREELQDEMRRASAEELRDAAASDDPERRKFALRELSERDDPTEVRDTSPQGVPVEPDYPTGQELQEQIEQDVQEVLGGMGPWEVMQRALASLARRAFGLNITVSGPSRAERIAGKIQNFPEAAQRAYTSKMRQDREQLASDVESILNL